MFTKLFRNSSINFINRINDRRKFKSTLKDCVNGIGVEILEIINYKHLYEDYVDDARSNGNQTLINNLDDVIEKIYIAKTMYNISDNTFEEVLDEVCNELNVTSYYFLMKVTKDFNERKDKHSVVEVNNLLEAINGNIDVCNTINGTTEEKLKPVDYEDRNDLQFTYEVFKDFDSILRLVFDKLYKNNNYYDYWIGLY